MREKNIIFASLTALVNKLSFSTQFSLAASLLGNQQGFFYSRFLPSSFRTKNRCLVKKQFSSVPYILAKVSEGSDLTESTFDLQVRKNFFLADNEFQGVQGKEWIGMIEVNLN